jgi:hypothetical protein
MIQRVAHHTNAHASGIPWPDIRLGAHCTRVGAVHHLAPADIDLSSIMHSGGGNDPKMPRYYTRERGFWPKRTPNGVPVECVFQRPCGAPKFLHSWALKFPDPLERGLAIRATHGGLVQPPAFAFEAKHVPVVIQAIKQRRDDDDISQKLPPVVHGSV